MLRQIFFPKKNLGSPDNQGADFVELFFDLVFVYAITKVTATLAHDLDGKHALQAVLVFWMIWWGWTQYTWALNSANTKIAEIRLVVLIATSIAFVMAAAAATPFTNAVMWFAIPYTLMRLVGITLYIRSSSTSSNGIHAGLIAFSSVSLLGLIAVFCGAVASTEFRIYWWLGAIFLDLFAGYMGGKQEGWGIQSGHFAERHGLIIIIALGESLIVAAAAIGNQVSSTDLIIVGGLAVLVTCSLWWSYFAWVMEYMEKKLEKTTGIRQTQTARDAYSFMHFPIICGIIGIAAAFEKILAHPHDAMTVPIAAALAGGFALYLGFTAVAVWRTGGLVLWPRLLILTLATAGIALSVGQPPQFALGVVAVGMLFVIFIEWKKCDQHESDTNISPIPE